MLTLPGWAATRNDIREAGALEVRATWRGRSPDGDFWVASVGVKARRAAASGHDCFKRRSRSLGGPIGRKRVEEGACFASEGASEGGY